MAPPVLGYLRAETRASGDQVYQGGRLATHNTCLHPNFGPSTRLTASCSLGPKIPKVSWAADSTRPNLPSRVTLRARVFRELISPATYVVRDAGSGGRYNGRNSRTRALRVRIEYDQPIRSAITRTPDFFTSTTC